VTHPAEWTDVAAVRELKNGRLVVLDAREQVIKLVDMKTGTATQIGRNGNGPGEYQMPLRLFALPGDSSAIWDFGNMGRQVTITSAGAVGDNVPGIPAAGFINRDGEGDFDALGRVYRLARGPAMARAIERLDRSTGRVDTVGFVGRRNGVCAGGVFRPDEPQSPSSSGSDAFETNEQWAVSSDGRIAFVCPAPYQVVIAGNGQRLAGPIMAYTPVPVTDADKRAWREERAEPTATLRKASNGPIVASFARHPVQEPDAWPATKPPFVIAGLHRALSFDPAGRLWIERAEPAGAPQGYDVVGHDGKLAFHVVFPARTVLVGFGAASIYPVRIDDNDIQRLERFSFPAISTR
jgi:hypothetical protein